ncbi:hypothetical protein HPB50_004851 [Hyalomma asiaticum]|uniref:Uncharacterized protein n=1 Tax=Hyalomma asiaticum TaxID=266040 RepID=A0ACB7SF20_HYAAI|nr:hypothetical protein HPB50_004851 [Hyalomma asiaticum]
MKALEQPPPPPRTIPDATTDTTVVASEAKVDWCDVTLRAINWFFMLPALLIFLIAIIALASYAKAYKWGPATEDDSVIARLEQMLALLIALVSGMIFYTAYVYIKPVALALAIYPHEEAALVVNYHHGCADNAECRWWFHWHDGIGLLNYPGS